MMEFVVSGNEAGDRIDRALAKLYPQQSRRRIRALIDEGAVYLNGRRCRKQSTEVKAGDRLLLAIEVSAPLDKQSISVSELEVVEENANWLAVNKPPGINALPTRHSVKNSMLYRAEKEKGKLYPLHRLDRDTSGILLFARNKKSAAQFSEFFRNRRIEKTYTAICSPAPEGDEGVIEASLKRVAASRMAVVDDGIKAVTKYRVIDRFEETGRVQLQPDSGRMHQLRVHLQHIGSPIVGDRKYGGVPAKYLMLHAERLEFYWCDEKVVLKALPPF